jgi:multiple sugar transport system permease protein
MEPWFLLAPALIAILAFMAYPIFDNIRISFLNYSLIHPKDIHFNGFDNYVKLFKSPDLGLVALNTFIWVISIVPLQAILGMALAQLLNRKFFGKGVFQSILFLPWVIAGFMTGLIFKWIFNEQSGILNYVLIQIGAINEPISWLADKSIAMIGPIMGMIWFGIPFFAIMFLAALKSIPQEIHESVMMDGAGPIKRFIFIDIPFIKPTIITTLLLRVIWVFNSSDVTFIMTGGGPGNSTSTLPLYAFRQAFATLDFGYAAAISNIITIVLVIYALFFLKVTKYQEAGDF